MATLTTPSATDCKYIGRPLQKTESTPGDTLGNEREDADKVCLTYEGNEATDKINELMLSRSVRPEGCFVSVAMDVEVVVVSLRVVVCPFFFLGEPAIRTVVFADGHNLSFMADESR